jgi:hypothetical protein
MSPLGAAVIYNQLRSTQSTVLCGRDNALEAGRGENTVVNGLSESTVWCVVRDRTPRGDAKRGWRDLQ